MTSPTLPKRVLARLERIPSIALNQSLSFLRAGKVAQRYRELRKAVYDLSGYDFLERVEMTRPATYHNHVEGYRSRHICGDAFDIDRDDRNLFVEPEDVDGARYWRLFVRSQRRGPHKHLTDRMGEAVTIRVVDFTELAEAKGFRRVAAWRGWQTRGPASELMNFWHFELTDGLTWDECYRYLYGERVGADFTNRPMRLALTERTYGMGDRSTEVRSLQTQLVTLELLPESEVDGVFGPPTRDAVRAFQLEHKLVAENDTMNAGVANPKTRRLIEEKVLSTIGQRKGDANT